MSGMERGAGQAPAAEFTQSADLVLLDVDVYRRSLHLIDRLTLAVGPGRILGVSGASGAGKTTLLRIIAGITHDYAGSVIRPEGRTAFVFQEPRLLPWLSARKNVPTRPASSSSPKNGWNG